MSVLLHRYPRRCQFCDAPQTVYTNRRGNTRIKTTCGQTCSLERAYASFAARWNSTSELLPDDDRRTGRGRAA